MDVRGDFLGKLKMKIASIFYGCMKLVHVHVVWQLLNIHFFLMTTSFEWLSLNIELTLYEMCVLRLVIESTDSSVGRASDS